MPDAAILARTQFAFTVSFHIIFPTISIGLALFLAVFEGLWLRTKDALYLQIYKFWLNIFAMAFGVGVVTGIVLSFEFGLGFAKFAKLAGPVFGPMIGLEVLTLFFLEAGFLGIMLFGLNRVGPRLHFFATCMVAVGTVLSASWILSANSWMQTLDGVVWENGRLVVKDWWRVIVNPSWLVRLPHMLSAAYLTGSFLVAGVGAWYLLKKNAPGIRATDRFARPGIRLGSDRRTGVHWGSALRNHVETPAGQNAGCRRVLAIRFAGALPVGDHPGPEKSTKSPSTRHALAGKPLADAQSGWTGRRIEKYARAGPAFHGVGLLWLSHDVCDRPRHVRARVGIALVALAWECHEHGCGHALHQLFSAAEAAQNRYSEFFGLGCECFAF